MMPQTDLFVDDRPRPATAGELRSFVTALSRRGDYGLPYALVTPVGAEIHVPSDRGVTIPGTERQAIVDDALAKGLIETSSPGRLTITAAGRHYTERT